MTYHETMTLFANAVYAEAHGIGSPEQRAAAWARLRDIARDGEAFQHTVDDDAAGDAELSEARR